MNRWPSDIRSINTCSNDSEFPPRLAVEAALNTLSLKPVVKCPPSNRSPQTDSAVSKAWPEADHAAAGRHFAYLQTAAERGQVMLAGRTTEPLDRTFGLVVFEAAGETAARVFMAADPAVAEGIMTAELHPYRVAVQRG